MLTHLIWHICYYKFNSNNIFVSNQSDSRERKEKINKLWIGLISFKILCLEILPSGQNKTYLWKMAMELGMFSLPHESLPCHGQRKSVPHLKPLRLQDLLPCLERILHWKLKSLKALKVTLKTITNIASCMFIKSLTRWTPWGSLCLCLNMIVRKFSCFSFFQLYKLKREHVLSTVEHPMQTLLWDLQ